MTLSLTDFCHKRSCQIFIFYIGGPVNPQTRKLFVELHLILGSFLIPVTFMFAVTGALYTFKITGAYKTSHEFIQLSANPSSDLEVNKELAQTFLKERGLEVPSGGYSIKKAGVSWQFEWTGSKLDFLLEPTTNPLELKASVKTTTWHRFFVQLHKAKGGPLFKLLAATLSVGLLLLLFSGWLLGQASPRLRKIRLLSSLVGVLTFILAAFLS